MTFVTLTSLALGAPSHAQGIQGRYLGSYTHYDAAGQNADKMRHLYDAVIREALPKELQLDLGLSLRYEVEPWKSETDLFQSRFYGDVRGASWRVHGRYVPWQRTQPAGPIPRKRDAQAGFDWVSPTGLALRFNLNRTDRETQIALSRTDDRRIDASFNRPGVGVHAGYRRLVGEPGGRGLRTDTNEYRAGVRGWKGWRSVSLAGSWDAIVTDRTSVARQIDRHLQSVSANAQWRPRRQVAVRTHFQRRWGRTQDTSVFLDRLTRELIAGASLSYLPIVGLSLSATREYDEREQAFDRVVSDYLRLEAQYRRALVRGTIFQTGYLQTIDVRSRGGGVPNSTIFGIIDGELRKGVRTRAELRASRSPNRPTGTQWQRVLRFDTIPTRKTRFDVLWQLNTLPEIEGMQQTDRIWELLGGYEPTARTDLIVSYRRLDGEGRVLRADDLWTVTASWRLAQRTSLSFNGSTRRSRLQLVESMLTVAGVDLTFWAAERSKVRASWRRSRTSGLVRDVSWNFIFSHTF